MGQRHGELFSGDKVSAGEYGSSDGDHGGPPHNNINVLNTAELCIEK